MLTTYAHGSSAVQANTAELLQSIACFEQNTAAFQDFDSQNELRGSIDLLDMALSLGQEELEALRTGEVEMAEACYIQRRHLLEKALVKQKSCDKTLLKERLLSMQSLQNLLMEEGVEQRRQLAERINQSKAQGRRLRGYHQAVAQARSEI